MTTPQTPAGWYADPDGSGGQRYWDGHAWTEHRAPAPQAVPPPPTSPEPSGASERVGAHRAPEDLPEAPAQPTAPVQYTATSHGAVEDSTPGVTPAGAWASSGATTATPPASGAGGGDRQLLTRYLAVCAVLLAVLVAVAVYAAFFADDGSVTVGASDDPATSEPATPTATGGNGRGDAPSGTATESTTDAPPPVETGEVTDGALAFTVHSVEVSSTVVSADVPVEKTATGEFVVVHLTVTNVSDAPATFLGTFQKLKAGGATYSIDDEATFYTGGALAELNPGDQADVAVAFDVPPGTAPESIELHADPMSPGVEVPLP